MQTVLRFGFPARRYHATPWGHHVNEGQVEWPPSPWRVLRALLSTGYTKLHWPAEGTPEVARRLIERLASHRPAFILPHGTLAHSRHYVDAAGKKPLIFDAWAQIEEGHLEMVWDVDLPADERALLRDLARDLGYLGRAESWVHCELADKPRGEVNCKLDAGGPPGPGWEAVRVLCPMPPTVYDDWRATQVHPIQEAHRPPAGKNLTAGQKGKLEKALAPYPRDLIDALCVDTGVMQGHGWSAAPGTQEILYWRKSGILTVSEPVPHRRQREESMGPFALLSISTDSGSMSALPTHERVYPQGRLLHRSLASIVHKQLGADPDLGRRLLGREGNSRANTNHQHAHLLYLDLGGSGRLDHVLVYVPMGLDLASQDALRLLRRTYMKGGAGELRVALASLGHARDLRRMLPPHCDALLRTIGPAGGVTKWHSATPYVAPRLLKKRGKDSFESQLRLECEQRGLPALVSSRLLDRERTLALRHYVLHDGKKHQPPWPMRYALELEFAQPVEGPICLGYGAHMGLGRFEVAV